MKEFRCVNCNKLLAVVKDNEIELKCPRCKTINKERTVFYDKKSNTLTVFGGTKIKPWTIDEITKLLEAPEAQKNEVSGNGSSNTRN